MGFLSIAWPNNPGQMKNPRNPRNPFKSVIQTRRLWYHGNAKNSQGINNPME